jgi:hypothetical protein
MKRLFFVAAALTLITAGVVANSKKLAQAGIYADNGSGGYIQLTESTTLDFLNISGSGTQATIVGSSTSSSRALWYDNGSGSKTALYGFGF